MVTTLKDTTAGTTPEGFGSKTLPRGRSLPELLAPAGDWDCARAAVENGADAIYFGLEKFNARMRAHNFNETDLPRLMAFLHGRGVKGYVTFNTLVFESELPQAERYLRSIIAAGVDALIVQDVGICRLVRQLSPDFPIHSSTQMTITSAAGVEFARGLGCNLVVLARECSLKEIALLSNAERAAGCQSGPLPIEVFVHGALCVAYSGQCLTSEALGGRSANRGECAQACRMPYELISNGKLVPLGDRRYLLSPQDLAGLEVLPELVRAGVSSLKIEGRLKSPEYVASITGIYRKALDQLAGTSPALSSSPTPPGQDRYELEMSFSRGLYTGWFQGIDNQRLVHARFGKKRGVYLGEVLRIERDRVLARLETSARPGDGVVFDGGHPEKPEQGGRIYRVVESAGSSETTGLEFGRDDVDLAQIHPGDRIWKTSDPELENRIRRSYSGDKPHHQKPVGFETHGSQRTVLTVIGRDELGNIAKAQSGMVLEKARSQPLNTERLAEQLGRLGGTPFKLGALDNKLVGDVILPIGELNRLRRECVDQLLEMRAKPPRWTLREKDENGATPPSRPAVAQPPAQMIALARSIPQLEAILREHVEVIYCELENPKGYRDAVQLVHSARAAGFRPEIFVAPPRVFKAGEEWILKLVQSSQADGWLVRNYDHLKFFAGQRMIGDFSLNIANHLAADYFKNEFGLERVTASYDLSAAQLEGLLNAAPPEWFEITLHQHMPMFHMEHCVFCAFLSSGKDYRDCGRPCDTQAVRLRDRVGAEHPLKADAGCRNTVFNSMAQTGAEFFQAMRAAGARHFRIEFLDESPERVAETIASYRLLFRGEITGAQLWRKLKLVNQLGVTRGQLAG
jgi:putative protease